MTRNDPNMLTDRDRGIFTINNKLLIVLFINNVENLTASEWKSLLFSRNQKKGRMEIQPEVYPISKPLSGLVSPRWDP